MDIVNALLTYSSADAHLGCFCFLLLDLYSWLRSGHVKVDCHYDTLLLWCYERRWNVLLANTDQPLNKRDMFILIHFNANKNIENKRKIYLKSAINELNHLIICEKTYCYTAAKSSSFAFSCFQLNTLHKWKEFLLHILLFNWYWYRILTEVRKEFYIVVPNRFQLWVKKHLAVCFILDEPKVHITKHVQ